MVAPAQCKAACRHVRLVHLAGAKKNCGLEGRFFCAYEYITVFEELRVDTGMYILFIHMFSRCFEPQNILKTQVECMCTYTFTSYFLANGRSSQIN
jgi:hypothetical protein